MRIEHILIHNFRGIIHQEFFLNSYTLLIGGNNAGKSTVVDAIRAFYEKDSFSYKETNDFPQKGAEDKESWIEVTFILSDEEYSSLADTYKYASNKLKVRKYFKTSVQLADGKTAKGAIVGYKSDGTISNEHFYGAKNVQTGKLGNIIYIPAISKVDDFTKLSGPSALRDLITNIMSGVIQGSEPYAQFESSVDLFSKQIKNATTEDSKSLSGFEAALNGMLREWGTEFSMSFRAPSSAELIKNMVQWDLIDSVLESPQTADKYGSGFQRHFIYSIIRLANDYMPNTIKTKAKDFSPRMNLLLFEEPEAFLHPPQQQRLCRDLIQLSRSDSWQVLATTHSSHFVSKSTDMLPSLIHLSKDDGITSIRQILQKDWDEIVANNGMIDELAKKYPDLANTLKNGSNKSDFEALRYFLCLNAERANAFFSSHTILVEGGSEVGIINRLIDDGRIPNGAGVCIFDSFGKYNIHRFMNLFGKLGITHSVIIDDDSDKSGNKLRMQQDVNQMIADSRNAFTKQIVTIPGNLELLLDIKVRARSDQKPQAILLKYDSGTIAEENIQALIDIVDQCLTIQK